MENKINIAEILKNCEKGMELDCILFKDTPAYFHGVITETNYPIEIKVEYPSKELETFFLNKYGAIYDRPTAKCVIFPKGKTTWEGFVPPCEFKDGDVLVHTQNGRFIMSIYKSPEIEKVINTHVIFWDREEGLSVGMQICCYTDSVRFATKEEKAKLFDAIKANGYRWNEETKTLEKLVEPRFKIGNRIKSKINKYEYTIIDITKDDYIVCYKTDKFGYHVPFCNDDEFDLIPDKFDITTLKPFESRVLARSDDKDRWKPAIFGGCARNRYNEIEYFYALGGTCWRNCIPYEGNEHLLGTTNDCDEYFKNWE